MFCIGKIGILKISSKYSKSSLEGKKIAGPGPWIMSQNPVFRSLSATASPFYSGSKMLWRFWRLRFLRGFKCFWRCWHDGEMSEGRKRRSGEEENSGHTVPGIDSVQCFHFCVFLLMVLVSGTLSRPFSLHGSNQDTLLEKLLQAKHFKKLCARSGWNTSGVNLRNSSDKLNEKLKTFVYWISKTFIFINCNISYPLIRVWLCEGSGPKS